jgi:hypothetical protein
MLDANEGRFRYWKATITPLVSIRSVHLKQIKKCNRFASNVSLSLSLFLSLFLFSPFFALCGDGSLTPIQLVRIFPWSCQQACMLIPGALGSFGGRFPDQLYSTYMMSLSLRLRAMSKSLSLSMLGRSPLGSSL